MFARTSCCCFCTCRSKYAKGSMFPPKSHHNNCLHMISQDTAVSICHCLQKHDASNPKTFKKMQLLAHSSSAARILPRLQWYLLHPSWSVRSFEDPLITLRGSDGGPAKWFSISVAKKDIHDIQNYGGLRCVLLGYWWDEEFKHAHTAWLT